jgi:sensor histidine kinase YesM
MTLGQFFDFLTQNPTMMLYFFGSGPLTAFLALMLGKGEGHLSPWKYLYSFLVYFVSIPGLFVITLSVYLFLFERQSIFSTDIYTQILPVVAMFLTLWLIKQNTSFDKIPGFDKIGGLIMIITAGIICMWFLEKTNIFAITFIPFQYFIILIIVLILAIRIGWSKISK